MYVCCDISRRTSATRKSTVRWMQPYVVAVLINAVANPLGVGSFILSLSLSRSLCLSFFLFTVHRDLLSLFFLISLANSRRITWTRHRIYLWDYESSEKLQKMWEIASRRPKMRLADDVAPFLFDICKQVKKYDRSSSGKQTSVSPRRRQELHFVNHSENRKKGVRLFSLQVEYCSSLVLSLVLIIWIKNHIRSFLRKREGERRERGRERAREGGWNI